MLVIFDIVGTLFSLDTIGSAFREEGLEAGMMECWFAKLLQTSMAATLAGRYIPFKESAEASLRQVLVERGIPYDRGARFFRALSELEPYDDARECLATLREEGHRLAALTNSSEEITQTLLQRAGFNGMFEAVVSCDEVMACKPHPSPYRMVVDRMEAMPDESCMVAAHGWDIIGAHAVGLHTIWISELEKGWPFPGSPPGAYASRLAEVPAILYQQAGVLM
ncbi:MAG: haloacid dehalogenase type II [Nitrospirota bacterium]